MTLEDQLIRDEGERLKMYRCSAGYLTIGVGHNLEAKPISRRASRVILADDIADAIVDLRARLAWASRLDAARREALVNMTFNLGIGGLFGFKNALAAMERGDYAEAVRHFKDSKWATQVGARADRVCNQILTGERT